MVTHLKLDQLTIDYDIQLQARNIDKSKVREYAEAIASGATLPAVDVFYDNEKYYLADGFHRVEAARFLGVDEIAANVRQGGIKQARIFCALANVAHGKPMSQAEKREAGIRLLEETDWPNREIARALAVTETSVRRWIELSATIVADREVTVTRNGTTYEMATENIGQQQALAAIVDTMTEQGWTSDDDKGNLDLMFDEHEGDAVAVLEDVKQIVEAMPDTESDAADEFEKLENYKRDQKTNREPAIYEPKGYDGCQTPGYAIDPLLPYLERAGIKTIWEPAQGEGYLVEAFYDAGYGVIGSDLQTGHNFLDYPLYKPNEPFDAIVTNPPYSVKYDWLKRCYDIGAPFALLMPVEMLGAKTAQEPFKEFGIEVMLLDKRVNFKMPNKGWDGKGAQFPVAWFTWGLGLKNLTDYRCHIVFGAIDPSA